MSQMTAVSSDPGSTRNLVVVVDDELSIRKSIEGVLSDEGYQVALIGDGHEAVTAITSLKPSVVLLDIWLPGKDGLEILKEVREQSPTTKVIMMSGHATISTAVQATKLGATDFIEKPLDLERMLETVDRACGTQESEPAAPEHLLADTTEVSINPIVFKEQRARGRALVQKTIAKSTIMYGIGLHSGKKSGLILEPLPANSGIHFATLSSPEAVPAHVAFVDSTGWATTVRLGESYASTIEHVMSALCALGISNLLIKCNGEIPVMDGSAREFIKVITEAGIVVQEGDWYALKVDRPIRVGNEKEWIEITPSDKPTLSITYSLEYPAPLGRQEYTFELGDSVDTYTTEISGARTFGFVKDIGYLQKQGLALGGRFDNFVLFGEQGPLNGALRYANEPVRHKILDAIGDLYLLGRPLEGKITARLTGHSDNVELLRAIVRELGL